MKLSFWNFLPGHYMYIEGTGVHAWNAAHLISPTLAPLKTYCLRFFYHMYGKDTGQLNVRVLDEARPEQPGDVVWTMLWEQGNRWLNASVDVQCASGCKVGRISTSHTFSNSASWQYIVS